MTSFNILSLGKHRIGSLSVTLFPLSSSLSLAHHRLEPCPRQYSSHSSSSSSSSSSDKVLTLSSINQNLVELRYEVRGAIAKRADQIRRQLKV